MYARLGYARMAPGSRARWDAARPQLLTLVREQPGFVSATALYNAVADEGGYFTVWATREAAEAAGAVIAPKLQELLAEVLLGDRTIRVFEVVETID